MKKVFLLVLFLTFSAPFIADAFLYEIKILSLEEIQKLSDEDLTEHYIEAKIEERASAEFHAGAGFSSKKEYESRKKLLRYIYDLKKEMANRESIQPEKLDEYLK